MRERKVSRTGRVEQRDCSRENVDKNNVIGTLKYIIRYCNVSMNNNDSYYYYFFFFRRPFRVPPSAVAVVYHIRKRLSVLILWFKTVAGQYGTRSVQ